MKYTLKFILPLATIAVFGLDMANASNSLEEELSQGERKMFERWHRASEAKEREAEQADIEEQEAKSQQAQGRGDRVDQGERQQAERQQAERQQEAERENAADIAYDICDQRDKRFEAYLDRGDPTLPQRKEALRAQPENRAYLVREEAAVIRAIIIYYEEDMGAIALVRHLKTPESITPDTLGNRYIAIHPDLCDGLMDLIGRETPVVGMKVFFDRGDMLKKIDFGLGEIQMVKTAPQLRSKDHPMFQTREERRERVAAQIEAPQIVAAQRAAEQREAAAHREQY